MEMGEKKNQNNAHMHGMLPLNCVRKRKQPLVPGTECYRVVQMLSD